jgi:hypothetical protein
MMRFSVVVHAVQVSAHRHFHQVVALKSCLVRFETLFCQCDSEDDLVECLSCGAIFELDTFCLRC